MRRLLAITLIVVMFATVMTGCSGGGNEAPEPTLEPIREATPDPTPTPTPEPTAVTTVSDEHYVEFPDVYNFGFLAEIEPLDIYELNGYLVYKYELLYTMMKVAGDHGRQLSFDGFTIADRKDSKLLLQNDNTTVIMDVAGIAGNEFFYVGMKEFNRRDSVNDVVSDRQYYTEFSDVLNFGNFVKVEEENVYYTNGYLVYQYKFMGDAASKSFDYWQRLMLDGFRMVENDEKKILFQSESTTVIFDYSNNGLRIGIKEYEASDLVNDALFEIEE